MFIYLDDSLIVDESDALYQNVMRAVRNLAIATYESKHILYGDYHVIETMRKRFRYDPDVWGVFNRIYQKYGMMDCPKELTYYVKVGMEGDEGGTDDRGRKYGQVSYSFFEDSATTQACNLISEDFNDCFFYHHVLNHYKKWHGIKIECAFNDVSGSGDRTKDNIRNCIKKKQVTLCIVDSDMKYMGQAISPKSTCGKCMGMGKRIATYVFMALDVHEVENLVPFNVLENLEWYDENRGNKDAFDCLLHRIQSEELLPFFDIKNGIVKDEELMNDNKYMDYARKCYHLNPTLWEKKDFDSYVAELEDRKEVYPHLLKGLLKSYLEYVKEHPFWEVELMEYQLEAWEKIGNTMLNMGCARNREALTG